MTNNEIIGQFIKFMNALLDKIEPAMNNGLISQKERTQLASIAERVAALEQKEDKVGVSSEEMGRAIATAISQLPPDQVGISEERVQDLLSSIQTYDDSELRGKVEHLESSVLNLTNSAVDNGTGGASSGASYKMGEAINITLPDDKVRGVFGPPIEGEENADEEEIEAFVGEYKRAFSSENELLPLATAFETGVISQNKWAKVQGMTIDIAGQFPKGSLQFMSVLVQGYYWLLGDINKRLSRLEGEFDGANSGNISQEFKQVKTFLTVFAKEMRDLQWAPAEFFPEKFRNYLERAIYEAENQADGTPSIFN